MGLHTKIIASIYAVALLGILSDFLVLNRGIIVGLGMLLLMLVCIYIWIIFLRFRLALSRLTKRQMHTQ